MDAKLCHRARERLVKMAQKHDIKLRQTYKRVGKFAFIMYGRYVHAKQYKWARRQLARVAFKRIQVFNCWYEAGLEKQGRSCQ